MDAGEGREEENSQKCTQSIQAVFDPKCDMAHPRRPRRITALHVPVVIEHDGCEVLYSPLRSKASGDASDGTRGSACVSSPRRRSSAPRSVSHCFLPNCRTHPLRTPHRCHCKSPFDEWNLSNLLVD